MKKLILSATLMIGAVTAFGQGQLIFANSSTTGVTNGVTGLGVAGGTAQDDTQVGLYVGNVGDAVSSLTLIGNSTNVFTTARYSGGTRTLAGWTGTVQLQVRAWLASTVYPSYEAAVAAGFGGDSSVLMGVSAPFTMALTISPTPAQSIANFGLTPIILQPIPEPSTIALGLLGLGAVALFRRKK